jgi:hypothetical protein
VADRRELWAAVALVLLAPAIVVGALVFGAAHFMKQGLNAPTAFESVSAVDSDTRALFGFPAALVPRQAFIRVRPAEVPGVELLVQLEAAQAEELKAAVGLVATEPPPMLDDVAQLVQRQCPVLRVTTLDAQTASLREAREFECADTRWLYLSAWVLP